MKNKKSNDNYQRLRSETRYERDQRQQQRKEFLQSGQGRVMLFIAFILLLNTLHGITRLVYFLAT